MRIKAFHMERTFRAPAFLVVMAFAGCGSRPATTPAPAMLVSSAASASLSAAPDFQLTTGAAQKVKGALAGRPESTHLVISVDFDDEKYCTGHHYRAQVGERPADSTHAFCKSEGIDIAIDRKSLDFLKGATLDWVDLPSGGGFLFRNPNEKKPESVLQAE